MEPLNFESVIFMGIDSMEPAFDPKIRNYTIHRKAGSDFRFKAILNRPEEPKPEDMWQYSPYPGFSFEMYVPGDVYKSFWSPGNWVSVNAGPGETDVSVNCILNRTTEGESSFYLSIKVHTEPLSEEHRALCTHPSTQTSEGQFWGGGSGSCTVCGATTNTYFDHRD
jgi:hypothetical protein